jgi:hypothetical protein
VISFSPAQNANSVVGSKGEETMSKLDVVSRGRLSIEEATEALSREVSAGAMNLAENVVRTGAVEKNSQAFWDVYYEISFFLLHFVSRYACFTLDASRQPGFIRRLFENTFPSLVSQEAGVRLAIEDALFMRFTKLSSLPFGTVYDLEDGGAFLDNFDMRNEVYYRHDIVFDDKDPEFARSLIPVFAQSIIRRVVAARDEKPESLDLHSKALISEILAFFHSLELPEMFTVLA